MLLIYRHPIGDNEKPTFRFWGPPKAYRSLFGNVLKDLKASSADFGVNVSILAEGQYRDFLNLECLGGSRPGRLRPNFRVWDWDEVGKVFLGGGEESNLGESGPTSLRLGVIGEAQEVANLLEKLFRFLQQETPTTSQ